MNFTLTTAEWQKIQLTLMEIVDNRILAKNQFMMKRMFVALALVATSSTFAQQKKIKQPPPPPPPVADVKDVPPPPPPTTPPPPRIDSKHFASPLNKEYQDFLKRNPDVKGIGWSENNTLRIHLKSGKEEVYDLNNEADAQKLKNKYGELPPPPPPPPAPKAPKKRTQA